MRIYKRAGVKQGMALQEHNKRTDKGKMKDRTVLRGGDTEGKIESHRTDISSRTQEDQTRTRNH